MNDKTTHLMPERNDHDDNDDARWWTKKQWNGTIKNTLEWIKDANAHYCKRFTFVCGGYCWKTVICQYVCSFIYINNVTFFFYAIFFFFYSSIQFGCCSFFHSILLMLYCSLSLTLCDTTRHRDMIISHFIYGGRVPKFFHKNSSSVEFIWLLVVLFSSLSLCCSSDARFLLNLLYTDTHVLLVQMKLT